MMQTAMKNVLALKVLTPNPFVNETMSQLVEAVIENESIDMTTLQPDMVLKVRRMSADAETEMEKYWAHRIIHAQNPFDELKAFPYQDNYTELTRRELALLHGTGLTLNATKHTLIIGSGPLPLTAYELTKQSGVIVDHVDASTEAATLGHALSDALNIASNYHIGYGQDVQLDTVYDFILIAALAGETAAQKQQIIDNVLPYLHDKGRIIIRSAKGAREILYPAIKADAFKHVTLLSEYHPDDYIINSVFVYSK